MPQGQESMKATHGLWFHLMARVTSAKEPGRKELLGSENGGHRGLMGNGLSLGLGQTSRAASGLHRRHQMGAARPPQVPRAVTSADALFLSRQDPGRVDDADAIQDRVGQLGAHEPARARAGKREVKTQVSLL